MKFPKRIQPLIEDDLVDEVLQVIEAARDDEQERLCGETVPAMHTLTE